MDAVCVLYTQRDTGGRSIESRAHKEDWVLTVGAGAHSSDLGEIGRSSETADNPGRLGPSKAQLGGILAVLGMSVSKMPRHSYKTQGSNAYIACFWPHCSGHRLGPRGGIGTWLLIHAGKFEGHRNTPW